MNLVSHSTLCINMAKTRRNKLTLKEKNKSHRRKSHSQSAIISRLDEEYDDQRNLSSTPKTCLDAHEWIDSILWKNTDTDEMLMTAQDSFVAVWGSIQSVAYFNKCKINVFILLINFSANWIKIFNIVCVCFVFVLSLIHVVNSTHTVLRA